MTIVMDSRGDFDLIWDTNADLMHHVLYYSRHPLQAMKGNLVVRPTLLSENVGRKGSKEDLEIEIYRRKTENKRRLERARVTREVSYYTHFCD